MPVLDCPANGYKPPAKWAKPIRDHEYYAAVRAGRAWPGHGRIGMDRALAKSSNSYYAQLGVRLGPIALNQAAAAWQLNQPLPVCTGVSGGMSGKAGSFPALDADDFGASAQIAIGQGALLVTPLHMALVGAAIANDGRMPAPRLTQRTPHATLAEVMSRDHAAKLRGLLRGVVTGGTGRGADIPGLDVAGKTGTAQAPGGDDHAWFVCMAPQAHPKIVVTVLVEHGGFGAEAALPVAVGLLKEAQNAGWLPKTPAAPAAAEVRR
jgi:peptidoglycan glycosyltransferase